MKQQIKFNILVLIENMLHMMHVNILMMGIQHELTNN
jgi:hypothetical protein